MIATATPWTAKPGCTGTYTRRYFEAGSTLVEAEVTIDGDRVWLKAWSITRSDRYGNPIRELIAHGSLAATPHALGIAKARASRVASAEARRVAADYYRPRLARAIERMEAARDLLDQTDLTDYRALVHRTDELEQLTAELDHIRRMMALAA